VHQKCCGWNLNKPGEIRGPFIIIKAKLELYNNEKLTSQGCVVQFGFQNTDEKKEELTGEPDRWYGKCPFHKLNDTKLTYCRNRYLLPDILNKAKDENTASDIFNAKNSFSRAKTARKLAVDHSCRTGCCVACKKLNDSMKTEVVALKTSYNGVKSGNVIAKSDKNGRDNIKKVWCECCDLYFDEWTPKVVQFGNEMVSDVMAVNDEQHTQVSLLKESMKRQYLKSAEKKAENELMIKLIEETGNFDDDEE